MDIKTFKYQGVVVGVMFGGYNGSPLDDTWLIVPGYGDQGIAWVRFHKRTVDTRTHQNEIPTRLPLMMV